MSEESPTEATLSAPTTHAGPVCPWCSAAVPAPEPERCPACGARLVEDTSAEIPGVTTIDPAILRAAAVTPRKRGKSGMTGHEAAAAASRVAPSSLEALAPPSPEVLAEMRRLRDELDAAAAAEVHSEAEAIAARTDGAEGG